MVKPILILAILSFFPSILVGQDAKHVDFLKDAVAGKTAHEKADRLLDLKVELVDNDNQEALAILECARQEATGSGDSSLIVTSMRLQGQVLYRLERTDEAVDLFQATLAIAQRRGFIQEEMMTLLSFANCLAFRSQYDAALQKFFHAKDIAFFVKDTSTFEIALNNIRVIYYKLKDYRKALYYWHQAYRLQKMTERVSHLLASNMSLAYANLKDFAPARTFLAESVTLCGATCPDRSMLHIKYTSGYIFLVLGELSKAEGEFLLSYAYSVKVGDHRMQLDNIYLLAEIYHQLGMIDEAFSFLNKGEELIKRGIPYNLEITKIYQRLSELYVATENFKRASYYQSKYISLKDSIYNEKFTTGLMTAESELLQSANLAKIASQKELILLKEQMIQWQMGLNILAVLLACMVTAFCIFLYKNFLHKKRLNVLLEQKVKERTYELECSRNEVLRSVDERDLLISRAAKEISQRVTSIRGLCLTGKEESVVGIPLPYFDRIDEASRALSGSLCSLLSNKGMSSRQSINGLEA